MNSHNSKTESVVRPKSVRITGEQDSTRVISSSITGVEALTISDDDDNGSDPYNSTGQHVIIKSRINDQD